MERKFIKIRETLRNVTNLKLPEYVKEFILKTDASNTGLGAVLLQKTKKINWYLFNGLQRS